MNQRRASGKQFGHRVVLGLLTLLFIVFACRVPAGHGEAARVIRVAGDYNFPPFEYLTESGVFTGFNVDIMNAVSIETGVKIEYVPMPWNKALAALRSGEIDAIQGMKYSEARDEVYDFSDPYFISSQGIFVLKENMHVFRLADLQGCKISVQKGDIANDVLRELKNAKVIAMDSQEEAIQLLLDGKVDAFIGNRITGQYFLQKKNQQSRVKIVGDPIDPTAYGVAVMPERHDLLAVINQGIAKIKSNGTYDKIERKWFGEYILPSASRLQKILLVFEWGLGICVAVFLVVLWWNRMLKKEVTRRTEEIARINQELAEKMAQLEENVHFQQQLLDSTYSSYVTLDEQGRITMINRKALRYLGDRDELLGRPLEATVLAALIPAAEVRETLENGTVHERKETVWNHPHHHDDQPRVIQYNIYPIVQPTESIAGAIINFQDVTEQKDLEKRMEQEDRLRSLGQLVLGIAHEIRNPLMSILTYAELLPHKFEDSKFRDFFALHVSSEIQRLNSLVNDLFDYARPKPSQPVRFSANVQLESVIQLLKQTIQEKQIRVNMEWEGELFVQADIHQLKQVWINVIMNALDSMETGGILTVRGWYQGDMTVIEVEDNGRGIQLEDKYKIFEPFYTTKANGVGLGLAITYRLIRENRGQIDVRSQVGVGTVMTIRLPRPEEGVEAYAMSRRY